VVVFVVTP
jgi:hypothetical protein